MADGIGSEHSQTAQAAGSRLDPKSTSMIATEAGFLTGSGLGGAKVTVHVAAGTRRSTRGGLHATKRSRWSIFRFVFLRFLQLVSNKQKQKKKTHTKRKKVQQT